VPEPLNVLRLRQQTAAVALPQPAPAQQYSLEQPPIPVIANSGDSGGGKFCNSGCRVGSSG
ncbi:MAG: hypothetical protein ACKPJJ_04200, partial [Planctomycetaceae bacterium]